MQQQQDGEEWVSSSYEQAQQSCSGVGSHLPTFKTQEEYEILLDILSKAIRNELTRGLLLITLVLFFSKQRKLSVLFGLV